MSHRSIDSQPAQYCHMLQILKKVLQVLLWEEPLPFARKELCFHVSFDAPLQVRGRDDFTYKFQWLPQ